MNATTRNITDFYTTIQLTSSILAQMVAVSLTREYISFEFIGSQNSFIIKSMLTEEIKDWFNRLRKSKELLFV